MAWLWGWMLEAGRDPRFGKFHWKHHVMIGDPRCERLRALLAMCSDESTCPHDAGEMRRLIARLGLSAIPAVSSSTPHGNLEDSPKIEKIVLAHQQAEAARELDRAARREQCEASAGLLGRIYDKMQNDLREVIAPFKERGLPIREEDRQEFQGELCETMLREFARAGDRSAQLFALSIGSRGVGLRLTATTWRPEDADELLPVRFDLQLNGTAGRLTETSVGLDGMYSYSHDREGNLWRLSLPTGRKVDMAAEDEPARLVRQWLLKDALWKSARGPA